MMVVVMPPYFFFINTEENSLNLDLNWSFKMQFLYRFCLIGSVHCHSLSQLAIEKYEFKKLWNKCRKDIDDRVEDGVPPLQRIKISDDVIFPKILTKQLISQNFLRIFFR